MATYEDIYGKRVKEFDSEPTLNSAYEGQVWYDKSSGTLKSVVLIDAFISGGNMSTARRYYSGFGTQTAAVAHGGSPGKTDVEHYNGIGWSSQTAMPATYSGQGASGTQTSGLVFGGYGGPSNPGIKSDTFEYNGSSWTSGGALGTARSIDQGRSSAGTQTAALGFGGYAPGGARSETEEYDGSSWTAGGALPAVRNHCGGTGTQTSALAFGGQTPAGAVVSTGLAYDGSSWTSGPSLAYAARNAGAAGTSTSSIYMAGATTAPLNTTNKAQGYDGTSWSEKTATLSTARRYLSGVGTGTAALASGGTTGSDSAATEEFHSSINTVTAAAWSSGDSLPNTAPETVATGSKTTALTIGAENGLPTGVVLEYNSSTWSSGGSLNTARYGGGASGTQTSGLYFTGRPTPGFSTATEGYDGSSWTSLNPVNNQGFIVNGLGTQTAAVLAGGRPSTPGTASNRTEDWDGTSWTNGNTMALARAAGGTAGTQTAGMIVGGSSDSFTYFNNTEHYNGSSWTSVPGTLSLARRNQRGQVGSQTSSLAFGGYNGSPSTQNAYVTSEMYDGTTWSVTPSMANKRSSHGGTGASSSDGLAVGGYNGSSQQTNTEEFTGETETVTAKTLTSS